MFYENSANRRVPEDYTADGLECPLEYSLQAAGDRLKPGLQQPAVPYLRAVSRRRRYRTAFTLVELMVVIVIIGLLAGAVTLSVRSYLIVAKQNVARMEISKICQALDTFYAAYDRYPTNEQGLELLVEPNEKFADGLLSRLPSDPWGNPYEYNHPGVDGPYDIICYGADAQEGGEGADKDISSQDLEDE